MKTKQIYFCALALVLSACSDAPDLVTAPVQDNSVATTLECHVDSVFTNETEVERIVNHLLKRSAKQEMSRGLSSGMEVKPLFGLSRSSEPVAYIANLDNEGGWAIVSGVKSRMPILAFSEDGEFDLDKPHSPVLDEWIKGVTAALQSEEAFSADSIAKYRNVWKAFEGNGINVAMSAPRHQRAASADSYYNPAYVEAVMKDSMSSWTAKGYEIIQPWGAITGDEEYDRSLWEQCKSGIWPEFAEDWETLTVAVRKPEWTDYLHISTVETSWHQKLPYNFSFPEYIDKNGFTRNKPVGCGPIAAGQIMYYHKYPETFRWDLMDPNSEHSPTIISKATSDFLYDLAIKSKADFSKDTVTSTYAEDVADALRGYGYSVRSYSFNEAPIGTELANGNPLYASSLLTKDDNTKEGHAWLITGAHRLAYTETITIWTATDPRIFREYHTEQVGNRSEYTVYINWGWGEKNGNGYYTLAYLVPPKIEDNTYISNQVYNILTVHKP